MSATKILIAAAVTVILGLACAKPRHVRSTDQNDNNQIIPKVVKLKDVLYQTVCPIMVDYDVDENRVPRRIKVMKCAAQPNRTAHKCCKHKDLECVEMYDNVVVFYKDKITNTITNNTMEVAVGCSCMIKNYTKASDL